jgi:hypothetical protein
VAQVPTASTIVALGASLSTVFRAAFEVNQRPVQRDLGQAGEGSQGDFLDAGLGCRSQRNRLPVAGQAAVNREDVDRVLFSCVVGVALGISSAMILYFVSDLRSPAIELEMLTATATRPG